MSTLKFVHASKKSSSSLDPPSTNAELSRAHKEVSRLTDVYHTAKKAYSDLQEKTRAHEAKIAEMQRELDAKRAHEAKIAEMQRELDSKRAHEAKIAEMQRDQAKIADMQREFQKHNSTKPMKPDSKKPRRFQDEDLERPRRFQDEDLERPRRFQDEDLERPRRFQDEDSESARRFQDEDSERPRDDYLEKRSSAKDDYLEKRGSAKDDYLEKRGSAKDDYLEKRGSAKDDPFNISTRRAKDDDVLHARRRERQQQQEVCERLERSIEARRATERLNSSLQAQIKDLTQKHETAKALAEAHEYKSAAAKRSHEELSARHRELSNEHQRLKMEHARSKHAAKEAEAHKEAAAKSAKELAAHKEAAAKSAKEAETHKAAASRHRADAEKLASVVTTSADRASQYETALRKVEGILHVYQKIFDGKDQDLAQNLRETREAITRKLEEMDE